MTPSGTAIRGKLPKGSSNGLAKPRVGRDIMETGGLGYFVIAVEPVAVTDNLLEGTEVVTLGIVAIEQLDDAAGADLIIAGYRERTGADELPFDTVTVNGVEFNVITGEAVK